MAAVSASHAELARMRAAVTQLYREALVWAPDADTPHAQRLVEDLARAVATCRFLDADIEQRRPRPPEGSE